VSCAVIGTADMEIRFRPPGFATPVVCEMADVASVRYQFFDEALDNLLRTEVTRPCVPGERYRVSIDLGPYNIRVQGLNAQQTVCYETTIMHTIEGGQTDAVEIIATPTHAPGCVYPTPAPSPVAASRPPARDWPRTANYVPPAQFSFAIASDAAGATAAHTASFAIAQNGMETYQAELVYPPEFGFNGFLALGPAGTQVGFFEIVLGGDFPVVTVPIRSADNGSAYVDIKDVAFFVASNPTIQHDGTHRFTLTVPAGGDPATSVAPLTAQASVELFAGILTNPTQAGTYQLEGRFVSVDPDTDGADDSQGQSPGVFSISVQVAIQGTVATGRHTWGQVKKLYR
jgi:hypothetical protein